MNPVFFAFLGLESRNKKRSSETKKIRSLRSGRFVAQQGIGTVAGTNAPGGCVSSSMQACSGALGLEYTRNPGMLSIHAHSHRISIRGTEIEVSDHKADSFQPKTNVTVKTHSILGGTPKGNPKGCKP